MKTRVLLFFLCILPFAAGAAGPGAAEFRGYMKANEIIRTRMFKADSPFQLGQYVGQSYDGSGTNLLDLLGTHKSGFAGGRFRNGTPNSLNMLIWHMLFSKLSVDIAQICSGRPDLDFSEGFKAAVTPMCGFPQGAANWEKPLFAFWLAVMNFDAPLSEFEEWRKFWTGPEAAALSGPEAVEWMSLSIMNNPYFLLRL